MTSWGRGDRPVVSVSGYVASAKSDVSRVGRDGKSRFAGENCPKRAVMSAAVSKMAAGGRENVHPHQVIVPASSGKGPTRQVKSPAAAEILAKSAAICSAARGIGEAMAANHPQAREKTL